MWIGNESRQNQGNENLNGTSQSETTGNVEYFSCLGSVTTNDPRCTREIKFRIAMAKAAFNRKMTIFTCKLDLSLRMKLLKCCTWRIALCGAETWTLWKGDQKYMELLKCGAGEGERRSGGPNV